MDELNKDKTIITGRKLFASRPICTGSFMSTYYDTYSIKLEKQIKPSLLLCLSIILGEIIGIIVLIIRNSVTPEI